jgi:hypothetical protein
MGQTSELFQKLKDQITSAEADVVKCDDGNHAAGVRVRKVMQEIKGTVQDIRKASMEK